MFNDLDQKNNNHVAVDDIFAETDKAPETKLNNGNIPPLSPAPTPSPSPSPPLSPNNENKSPINRVVDLNNSRPSTSGTNKPGEIAAQKVGLAVDSTLNEGSIGDGANNKWFKIILIFIVGVIVILSAYLLYNKFKKVNPQKNSKVFTPVVKVKSKVVATSTANSLVPTSTKAISTTTLSSQTVIPLIPGVNTISPTSSAKLASSSKVNSALLDSDSDGLTNAQEKLYGTNPYVADTDKDNLSDYEEIKIYHTDPLNPDTDGDGFSDGMEVKSGYNPLGAGKLNVSKTATIGLSK